MAIYIQYGPKGYLPGAVTSAGYEGWIQVNSYSWGVGRGIASPTGSAAEREATPPSVSEITITKVMDAASFKIFQEALWGEGKPCEIHFVKTDATGVEPYAKYILENCLISGYSVSSGGDKPTESLSLNFTKISFTYVPMKSANETGDPQTSGYDLGLQKSI